MTEYISYKIQWQSDKYTSKQLYNLKY